MTPPKIFHIRESRRGAMGCKTLCGAPATSHDNSYSWQVFATGNFKPCAECVRLKTEHENAKWRQATQ